MDTVITAQPHLLPGYTGHCPQARFRVGKTYGKLSHKLYVDPCVNHAPTLIVNRTDEVPKVKEFPTDKEIATLKQRERFVDPIYRHPIIPGYEGFIPEMASKVGKRYLAAATAGVAEHEVLMDYLRCKARYLQHGDLLESGHGLFEHKLGERLIPTTKYRSPLIPVSQRSQAIKMVDCSYKAKREPYSKATVPHFMENDDEEKFIMNGYGGHIPMAISRFGMSNKQLTHSALCAFSNNYHHRRKLLLCPGATEMSLQDGHERC